MRPYQFETKFAEEEPKEMEEKSATEGELPPQCSHRSLGCSGFGGLPVDTTEPCLFVLPGVGRLLSAPGPFIYSLWPGRYGGPRKLLHNANQRSVGELCFRLFSTEITKQS